MSEQLDTLRAAKQALNEQLITQADFDAVKLGFLRAQQIKAGLDAGFIRREDYDRAVDAYLHAMDFQVMTSVTLYGNGTQPVHGSAAQPAVQPQAAAAPSPSAPRTSVVAGGNPLQLLSARNSSSGSGSASAATAAAPPPPLPAAAAPAAEPKLQLNSSRDLSMQPSFSASDDAGSTAEIPADLPDYCKGATVGKKSMSGIGVEEVCVNLFMHMKTRNSYKWLIFKVDSSGRMVVPDKIGGQSSSYNDFMCALPDDQCRYAVYDYEYKSPERGTFKKLVFLLWAPEHSGIKPKMMYASTKDFFKGFLDGIGAELQANEPSELSEEEIRDRVLSNMTRK